MERLGLIAGNGRFPFLLLDAARAQGRDVVVAAIREETDPEIDARAAADPGIRVHWLSLGKLSRLIDMFHREGVRQAVGGLRARVCVASSSAPERLRFALRVTGYEVLFAPNIFSAAEVAEGKPSPDLFLFAARAMGAAPKDCLVIEDSVAGVVAARAAGMTVFGFVGASHFSPFDEGADLTAAGAELLFDDMARLPDLVAARSAGANPAGMD